MYLYVYIHPGKQSYVHVNLTNFKTDVTELYISYNMALKIAEQSKICEFNQCKQYVYIYITVIVFV